MGVKIYYYIVAAILVLGVLMPQWGRSRTRYVTLMAILHAFICGWRYMYLHGDLYMYSATYYQNMDKGWFDPDVFQEGRNFGFYWLQKVIANWTDGDFQVFLIFIAIVTELAVMMVILRYSPYPVLSFLLWDCFGFYVFGFIIIRQALAMALLMFAFCAMMERHLGRYLLMVALAGTIHAPALIFLPAYWLVKNRLSVMKMVNYAIVALIIFKARNPIVEFISEFYYEETDFAVNSAVGGRFMMIVAMIAAGVLLRGFVGRDFNVLLNLMVVAAIVQMFSGFDNVFTRLTDYYFQFVILYLPMMFYPEMDIERGDYRGTKYVRLSQHERAIALLGVVLLAILYYHVTMLNVHIELAVDDYLNYRFCWEVPVK